MMQLHLVAESCTICSSRSRRPVPENFGYTLVPLSTPNYSWIQQKDIELYIQDNRYYYAAVTLFMRCKGAKMLPCVC
jgi:hypothetical protein